MYHIPIRRLIKTPLMLCILSWFAIADTTPQASALAAEWTPPPEEVPTNAFASPGHTSDPGENNQQRTDIRTADYRATTELLLERYPYALMSYLSEMDAILTSDDLEKQIFTIFRLSYLDAMNFQFVAKPEAIPEQWQAHFIATGEQTLNSGKTSRQIIGQITLPDSNIRIRVFKRTEDLLSDAPSQSKIVLALSGEKSNETVQCLVSQSKPPHPVSSPCSDAVKHLQDITDLADDLKEIYPNHSLEITGYSFSGAVVQAAMAISDTIEQAYIFNSHGIHPSWLAGMPEDRLTRIHHSYVEGSFLHGQDYNLLSRYSRWKQPPNKVAVAGMKIPSSGLEPHIRHIYQLNHHDGWLDTFYNYITSIWILHSKESVLRAFEANLKLDFPW